MLIDGLYGMVDPAFGEVDPQLRCLVGEGVRPIQVRCKGWPRSAVRELVTRWRREADLIVNDDAELAAELGLLVHLGHDDGQAQGPFGRSTHNIAQVRAAAAAVYVGFGPIFSTPTKAQRWSPTGVSGLRDAVLAAAVPIVAIGGINPENIDSVRGTGVAGWAVLAGIWRATDPKNAIRALRK